MSELLNKLKLNPTPIRGV